MEWLVWPVWPVKRRQTMIVLNVTYKCKPEMREDFMEAIITEGIDVACRAESGNMKYEYYYPAEEGDELLLIEKWTDADALAAHWKQEHYLRLGELKKEFVNETVVEKFVV